MGLYQPGFDPGFNVQQIGDGMRNTMNAVNSQGYCIIIDPIRKIKTQNIMTGEQNVLQFPIGSGPMRMQQLRRPLTAREQANDTTDRMVQFSIEYPRGQMIPEVRPGHEIVVTNGGNDPFSSNYQYVVTAAINSTMAWHRTINTLVNAEADPNYMWSFLTGSVTGPAGDLSGVMIDVAYSDSHGVYQPYVTEVTYDKFFRIPCFVGSLYQLTFSKPGYPTQVISGITPQLRADTPLTPVQMF